MSDLIQLANGKTSTMAEWVAAGLHFCRIDADFGGIDWAAFAHSCASDIMALEALA